MIRLPKDELGGKIMIYFAALRPKTYSYLTNDNDGHKKAKDTKKCVVTRKLKLENKMNQLENNECDVNSIRENNKEFIKNSKLLLKSQQRLRGEKHNVFTKLTRLH